MLLALALGAWPVTGWSQTLADARTFTEGLYRPYKGGSPDYLGKDAAKTFSPRMLALMRADAAQTPKGEVGALDGDPICDCQDSDGLGAVKVSVSPLGKGARAIVRFAIAKTPRSVTLDLVAVGGHWRVNDVHTPDTPSLVRLFQDAANPKGR